MPGATLDQILDELNNGRQRATYGAVAAAVGASPRALMSGRERDQRHSWVVSLKSGLPTDYPQELMHPELALSATVITTKDELLSWLSARGVHWATPSVAA